MLKPYGPSNLAKEGVVRAKVGDRFMCKVDMCNVSYVANWLFQRHLDHEFDLAMGCHVQISLTQF
jgi:hypothetical protein